MQHIANVETLQQFSPAYPLQPIYRPVVYNHGSLTHFKENDAGELRTAPNATATDNKDKKDSKNTPEKIKTNENVTKPITNIPSATSEKTAQIPKIEKSEQIAPTGLTKSEVTDAPSAKLPTPMDKILTINADASKAKAS